MLRFYPEVEITGDADIDTQRIHSEFEWMIRAVSRSMALDSPALENTASRRTIAVLNRCHTEVA